MVGRICRQASKHTFQAGLDTKVLWGSGHDFWDGRICRPARKVWALLGTKQAGSVGLEGWRPSERGRMAVTNGRAEGGGVAGSLCGQPDNSMPG